MTLVRKAVAKDFEETYPLFEKFKNPRLLKDDWRQLFVDHWQSNEGYFGYVLEDEERIVGFLGLIFSRRILNGKEVKFCNITSWVVDAKFRNQSLSLFLPVLKLKDYVLTIHTVSKETYAVARKLGFENLESHLRIILPLPPVSTWFTFCEVKINDKHLNETLKGEALQAYFDHLSFRCFHVLIRTHLGECYLIGTRVYRKKLSFFQIHHISNPKIFSKFAGRIAMVVCLQIKTVAMVVDERFLQGNAVILSKVWPLPYPRVYKPDSLMQNDIDLLYSELPVLNI
jgi:hypothetical protein